MNKTDRLIARAPYGNLVTQGRRKLRAEEVRKAIEAAHKLAQFYGLRETTAALLTAASILKHEITDAM